MHQSLTRRSKLGCCFVVGVNEFGHYVWIMFVLCIDFNCSADFSIIFEKIDADKDGFVTEDELRTWIQRVQKLYIINDTERMWKDHQPNENGILTWGPYQKRTFGYEDGRRRQCI